MKPPFNTPRSSSVRWPRDLKANGGIALVGPKGLTASRTRSAIVSARETIAPHLTGADPYMSLAYQEQPGLEIA